MSTTSSTRRSSEEELKERMKKLADELRAMADTYFRHPVKEWLLLPTNEHDRLKIRFAEPVTLRYNVDYRGSNLHIRADAAVVTADYMCCTVSELDIGFINGTAEVLSMRDPEGDAIYMWYKPARGALFLSTLFTPDLFQALKNAEISSERGVAEKRLVELIEAYEEVMQVAGSVDINDLLGAAFDTEHEIDQVELEVYKGKVELSFNLLRSEGGDIFTVYAYLRSPTGLNGIGDIKYYVEEDVTTSTLDAYLDSVMVLLEKTMPNVRKFVRDLFRAYTLLMIADRYLRS